MHIRRSQNSKNVRLKLQISDTYMYIRIYIICRKKPGPSPKVSMRVLGPIGPMGPNGYDKIMIFLNTIRPESCIESPPPAVLGQRRASSACPNVDRDQHHTFEVDYGVTKWSSSLKQAISL